MSSILVISCLLLGGVALLLGIVIGIFVRLFRVKGDPLADLALELLPGANCGGCGYAGCADFARALASGRALPGGCPVSSAEQVSALALALGVDSGEVERRKAVVLCRCEGGEVPRMNYNGVPDCAAAALVAGGPDACRYGCIGLGTCARHCPFGAIEIVGRVAVVHSELCVGCGKCVEVCPHQVIKLVPAAVSAHVYCNSPEKAANKRSVCKAGCLGCGKCARKAPEHFTMTGFLARVNYDAAATELPEVGCPAGGILTEAARQKQAYDRIGRKGVRP